MLYDFTILGLRPNQLGAVMKKLPSALNETIKEGALLGCFSCEFGVLNRFAVLIAYRDEAAAQSDRAAMLKTGEIYGVAEHLGSFERMICKPFSYMPDIQAGPYGPYYEIRTYGVAPGGLQETSDAWGKVVPRRQQISKLLTVMGSIDAAPTKMIHIWPYRTVEERMAARAQASREGIWPPPGGSTHLISMQSDLFVATAFSPLS